MAILHVTLHEATRHRVILHRATRHEDRRKATRHATHRRVIRHRDHHVVTHRRVIRHEVTHLRDRCRGRRVAIRLRATRRVILRDIHCRSRCRDRPATLLRVVLRWAVRVNRVGE